MVVKKIFIEKGNTGLYTGKYIDENGREDYIYDAYNCLTKIGCKIAINSWLREQGDNIVYSRDIK